MKYLIFCILFFLISNSCFATIKDTITFKNPAFSINKNQWNENILFKAKISNGNLWLEKNCMTFDIQNSEDLNAIADFKESIGQNIKNGKKFPDKVRHQVYKIFFDGMNTESISEGFDKLPDYENYFVGNDKNHWASNVPKFTYVVYNQLYKNIDFKVYGSEGFLKWDFIVHPNAEIRNINMRYEGISDINISNGNLVLKTNAGKIVEMAPYSYQFDEAGKRVDVACQFVLSHNVISYSISKDYDSTKTLIIDPILVYASYTGSVSDNWGYTATYDYNGYIFGGGSVFGANYPITTGAFDTTFSGGACDIGITKFDPNSSQLVYSTFLGGSGSDVPTSLIVNSADELFILGTTGSSNFPITANAYDNSFNGGTNTTITSIISFPNGSDLFISRLNNAGNQLLASTYFGGTSNDGLNSAMGLDVNYADQLRGEILMDKNNNCYIVSSTLSTNLPTSSNVFQPVKASFQDGLVAKLDNNLSNLIWCSYLGGNQQDACYAIALTKNEDILVAGGTTSTNLPTTAGSIQPTFNGGSSDGYVAKINKNGNAIQVMTYFGSPFYDQCFFVDVDRKDHIYLYGQTDDTSSTLIYNALWNLPNGGQFVSKLKSNLSAFIWSTLWGTSLHAGADVSPSAFMVDLCNKVYMSAWGGQSNYFGTTNGLPVTTNAFQSTTDGSDYYFLVINDNASAMNYATFYGGSQSHEHVDGGTSRFDKRGKLYQAVCAGCGGHDDFPTTTLTHSHYNNSTNCNLAVMKFDFDVPVVIADFTTPAVGCVPYNAQFVSTSYVTTSNASCHWDFGNGNTSNSCTTSYTYLQGGIYNVTLIITDSGSCNISDTIVKQVAVIEGHRDTLTTKEICLGDFIQIGILPINNPSLTYSWNNVSTLSASNISNPFASPISTTYYTLLFSNGLCTDTLVQKVVVYNIIADAGADTSLCYSTITLSASSNFPALNYQWSSNSNFTDTLNASLLDSTLTTSIIGATYYFVKISWGQACYDFDSVLVTPRVILNTLQLNNPKCFGDTNGYIEVQANGGIGPYSYNWSSGQSLPTINSLAGGNYSVTATDIVGCFAIDTFNLVEPLALTTNSLALNIPCQTACIGKAWANPSGGTLPYSWQWNDAGNQSTNPATNLCAGNYIVTVTDYNNCQILDTINIIDSSIYIILNATVSDDTIYEGQEVQIISNYLGQTYAYSWTPTNGLNNPSIYNPKATPSVSTTYFLSVTDPNGCSWYDTVAIYVIDVICDEPYIYVPNAFTPDGDGRNDILYVRSSVGYDVEFKIFNRWGEMVFEAQSLNHGWDGTFKGKKVDSGVFDYYVQLRCFNHEVFFKKGNITLIR